jgi:hypothetical protein
MADCIRRTVSSNQNHNKKTYERVGPIGLTLLCLLSLQRESIRIHRLLSLTVLWRLLFCLNCAIQCWRDSYPHSQSQTIDAWHQEAINEITVLKVESLTMDLLAFLQVLTVVGSVEIDSAVVSGSAD